MTSKFKQLFAAAALTLIIGGSIGANALSNMKENDPHENGWFGLRAGGIETDTPVTMPQSADCDDEDVLCAQQYVNGEPAATIDAGPYNK